MASRSRRKGREIQHASASNLGVDVDDNKQIAICDKRRQIEKRFQTMTKSKQDKIKTRQDNKSDMSLIGRSNQSRSFET